MFNVGLDADAVIHVLLVIILVLLGTVFLRSCLGGSWGPGFRGQLDLSGQFLLGIEGQIIQGLWAAGLKGCWGMSMSRKVLIRGGEERTESLGFPEARLL